MRISFHLPGYLFEEMTDPAVEDSLVLRALDGWQYEGGNLYNYVDMELVDQGVVGGTVRASWAPDRGLRVVVDYWTPDSFLPSSVSRLRDDTLGQLSDGIGAGGFEVTANGRSLVLVADTDEAPEVEQAYDGKPVPTPSAIARAARDGDISLLKEAIATGEAIDSTIQGYSGLHLAITFGHVDAAILLLSLGANPNLVVGDGDETPLHICALSNSLEDGESAGVAQALLEHGADKSMMTASGQTASSFAAIRRKAAMLRILSGDRA